MTETACEVCETGCACTTEEQHCGHYACPGRVGTSPWWRCPAVPARSAAVLAEVAELRLLLNL